VAQDSIFDVGPAAGTSDDDVALALVALPDG
jgi:hypothetical protein